MSTAKALVAMTAQRSSATTDDGVHHLAVLQGQVRSMPFIEAAT
jgi:hypothetical protein